MSETPLTVVERVQRVVRDARLSGEAICPIGGGVQRHIGYPAAPDSRVVSTTSLNHIVEYMPDDMVVIAQAGVTLAVLQAELAKHGQWLPIEVAAPSQQTLGGIVATRAASVVRSGYGAVRDWLIGLAVIGGDGQLIRGGGKVVKNVSGYDLPKLYCGSWGTLGLIVETAFKVAPLPQASTTLLISLPYDDDMIAKMETLLALATPVFAYAMDHTAAAQVVPGDRPARACLALRYDGAPEAVDMLAERVRAVRCDVEILSEADAGDLLTRLRDFSIARVAMSIRLNVLPSNTLAVAELIQHAASQAGFQEAVLAEAAVGSLYAHLTPLTATSDWVVLYELLVDISTRSAAIMTIEQMPEVLREMSVPVWSPVGPDVDLMRWIKKAFDPGSLFNPGRYIGKL